MAREVRTNVIVSAKAEGVAQTGQQINKLAKEGAKATDEQTKGFARSGKRQKELTQLSGETAQANYDAAETQYLVAKSNFAASEDMIFIDAPFDGYIVDMKVNEGDNVKKDAYLFTMSQLNRMKAKVWVTDKEIGLIKKGMNAGIMYNNKTYQGEVTDVSLGIDPMRIQTSSGGETEKFGAGTTEEAYQLNRRAHFIVMEPQAKVGARIYFKYN